MKNTDEIETINSLRFYMISFGGTSPPNGTDGVPCNYIKSGFIISFASSFFNFTVP